MGLLWDEVFGWDFDRMRFIAGCLTFFFLFTGFMAVTEDLSFWAPSQYVAVFIYNNEVWFLGGLLLMSLSTYWWWRREAGW